MLDKIFPEYCKPTDDDFNAMWESGLFVLDTNVLLDLYRHSDATRDQLFNILEKIKSQLWIPHQVGLEFMRRRREVIIQQKRSVENTINVLNTIPKYVCDELEKKIKSRHHPIVSIESVRSEIEVVVQSLCEKFSNEMDSLIGHSDDDQVFARVCAILESRIGDAFLDDEFNNIIKDGENRYSQKIPPGFKDESKGDPAKYGDLILWKQMIKKVSADDIKFVVFVTGEKKDDWWQKSLGETIGPCPELCREMLSESDARFYIYSTDGFLKNAKSYLDLVVTEDAIDEIRELEDEQEKLHRNAFIDEINSSFGDTAALKSSNEFADFSKSFRDHLEKDHAAEFAKSFRDHLEKDHAAEFAKSFRDHLEKDHAANFVKSFRDHLENTTKASRERSEMIDNATKANRDM